MISFLDHMKLILKNAFFTTLSVAEQTVIFNFLESYFFVCNPICNKDLQLQDHPDHPGRFHRPEGRHLGPDH